MIRFEKAAYTYPGASAPTLQKLHFSLPKGSFHFVCGPSGAGKTTLFRMLYMDILPTEGRVFLFDEDISRLPRENRAALRRHMGLVFQDSRLLGHLSVRENVALPLSLHGQPTPAQEKCIDEILDWVGLGHKMNTLPEALSGGEKQRVAIARAVVNRPKLVLADEPSGNVDDKMARRIMYLLTELNKHGTTVLVATHDATLLRSFSFPVLRLENGTLVPDSTPAVQREAA